MALRRRRVSISLAGIGIPLITVAASLGGVYMGQRMIAIGESNKIIRDKLERAYDITLAIPELALAVNYSAIDKVTTVDSETRGAVYNRALSTYREKLTEIRKLNALYVEDISDAVNNFSQCSEKFIAYSANHMLLERREAGMQLASPLMSYQDSSERLEREESLNATAYTRLKCEMVGEHLKATIAQVMKRHI